MVLIRSTRNKRGLSASRGRVLTCFSISLLLMCIEIVILVVDPLELIAKISLRISNNSLVYQFLQKDIDGILISAYLYNITNADRFLSGEDYKLKLNEVGPFTYNEKRINTDMEVDTEAGVLRYTPKLEQTFVPELSVGAPEDVVLTLPNIVMLTLCSWTSGSISGVVANSLMRSLDSKAIIKINARDFMWGYDEPLVKLASTMMPEWIYFEKLGIFDRFFNERIQSRLEVSTHDDTKFMIIKRNGLTKLNMTDGENLDKCKACTFKNAYEGILFPIPVRPETPIRLFRAGLCKIVDMVYHEKKFYDGNIETLVFNLSDSFYGPKENGGLLDLSACFYGAPLLITKHQFAGVDPKYYERIEGINPALAKNSYILVVPQLGMSVDARFVIQFNLVLKDIYNSQASKFANMIVPLGYVDIKQARLPNNILIMVRIMSYIGPIMLLVIRVVLFLLSLVLMAYSVLLFYSRTNERKTIFIPMLTTKQSQSTVTEPLLDSD